MSTALSAAMPSPQPLFPPLTRDLAVTSLIAGIAADLTWEFWARVITPFLPGVGGPLEPAALVQSVFGLDSRFVAEMIHLVVGFVFYPLGYLFVARPLAQAIVPSLPWWIVAAGFGIGLVDLRALYHGASDRRAAGLPRFHPPRLGILRRSRHLRHRRRSGRQVAGGDGLSAGRSRDHERSGAAMSNPSSEAKRPRDPRLDVFRGVGMLIILVAHIPGNAWADWIPARFGFSDATEIFVFCSGVASALAFGRVFDSAGWALGTARILHRVWQVYWAHIGVFVTIVACSPRPISSSAGAICATA